MPCRQEGVEPRESGLGLRTACGRIAHDADGMAETGLHAHEIADMAEQPADGRAEHMQDFQFCLQNQRSRI